MSEKLLLEGDSMWLKQSKFLWLLDPGHSGIDSSGRYLSAPAKMHTFDNGLTVWEGVINRSITNRVVKALVSKRIDYAVVADEVEDTSLEQRVRTADAIYAKDKRSVYLSIHSNASPEHNGAGWEIFTYFGPEDSKSKKIGKIFERVYRDMGKGFKFRGLKEENFYVLRKTDCPAILVENLFFDNLAEAQYLISAAGQQAIADMIVMAIIACEAMP